MLRPSAWIGFIVGFALTATIFGLQMNASPTTPMPETTEPSPSSTKTKSLVVAGGCFWCLEVIFEELKGVSRVESAYVGGKKIPTSYQEVVTGTTGHAEAIKIDYDPNVISARDLLSIFFTFHDPTTLNRQGPDVGTQYRSAVFYANEDEKKLAQSVIDEITKEKIWKNPIVTTLEPLKNYQTAEDYHQDYYAKFETANLAQRLTMNAGYCTAIIEPKVRKFREKYAHLLKKRG